MTKKIAVAAVFALLTVAMPARAAVVKIEDQLDLTYAVGNPVFPPGGEFTGDLTFSLLHEPPTVGWIFNGSLDFNGFPAVSTDFDYDPPPPPTVLANFFVADGLNSQSLNFVLNANNLQSLTYADFGANSGTVTILSETLSPVPLPAALPLFGSGVVALAGLAWRKGKV